jgi:hypothetical protein
LSQQRGDIVRKVVLGVIAAALMAVGGVGGAFIRPGDGGGDVAAPVSQST